MVQSAHRARQGTRCDYKQQAATIKRIQAALPTLFQKSQRNCLNQICSSFWIFAVLRTPLINQRRTNNQAHHVYALKRTVLRSTLMAGQNAGKGQGDGHAGRDGRSGAGQKGRRSGYSAKPKTTKVGLCKELVSNVFHYGGYNAANTMRVTQEKIQ
jgi:hypothetical protein